MDKIEVRLNREQCDILIWALGIARAEVPSSGWNGAVAKLQVWMRARRERRWGDSYLPELTGTINPPVGR